MIRREFHLDGHTEKAPLVVLETDVFKELPVRVAATVFLCTDDAMRCDLQLSLDRREWSTLRQIEANFGFQCLPPVFCESSWLRVVAWTPRGGKVVAGLDVSAATAGKGGRA